MELVNGRKEIQVHKVWLQDAILPHNMPFNTNYSLLWLYTKFAYIIVFDSSYFWEVRRVIILLVKKMKPREGERFFEGRTPDTWDIFGLRDPGHR